MRVHLFYCLFSLHLAPHMYLLFVFTVLLYIVDYIVNCNL